MKKSDKLDGYSEIEVTSSKKEELLELLKDYKVEIHTCIDTEYDYLEDNDIVLTVNNPYGDNDMDIELASEFTIYFDNYHAHYFPYENEYRKMIKDIQNILACKACVIIGSSTKRWLGSTIIDEKVSFHSDKKSLLLKVVNQKEFLKEIENIGGELQAIYWNPEFNVNFDL